MIELKHLRSLQAIRRFGSLGKAADSLYITQSALSHQFNEIEQRLGYRLFIRKSQPVKFTEQGSLLVELADQVLPQIKHTLQQCTGERRRA